MTVLPPLQLLKATILFFLSFLSFESGGFFLGLVATEETKTSLKNTLE